MTMKKPLFHALNKAKHHSKMHKGRALNKWLESSEGKEFLSREEVRGKKLWGER